MNEINIQNSTINATNTTNSKNSTKTKPTCLLNEVLLEFRTKVDMQGHEFKLRYPKSQSGNTRFARSVAALFPTRTLQSKSSRSAEDVAVALAAPTHVAAWRARYAHLPHNTEAIIDRWLARVLLADTVRGLQAAACIVFASRSTIKLAPEIVSFFDDTAASPQRRKDNFYVACWRKTEKCGKPRIVPLLFKSVTLQQYKLMAEELPRAKEWTDYEEIWDLFDQLDVPVYSRKGNLPRLILCGLMDRAESDSERLAPLMAHLPRGRADLFNLVLGHISRSYLLWTYMGMLIKQCDDAEEDSKGLDSKNDNKENAFENNLNEKNNNNDLKEKLKEKDQELNKKNRQLEEKDAEIEALRAQLARLEASNSPASSIYSLSPLSSPLKI